MAVLLPYFSIVAFPLIIWYLYQKCFYWRKFPHIPNKNQSSISLLWSYLTNWRLSSHMMQLYKMCRQNGWTCAASYLILRPIFFVASPTLLKEICAGELEPKFHNRGSYYNTACQLENLNLFNMKDEQWLQWRKTMSACFGPNKQRRYMNVFENYAHKSLQVLDRLNLDAMENIDFFAITNCYSYNVAQHLFLGREANNIDGKNFDEEYLRTKALFRPNFCDKFTDIMGYFWPSLLRTLNRPEFPSASFSFAKSTLQMSLENDTLLAAGSFPDQLKHFMTQETNMNIAKENIIGVLSALFLGGLKSTTPLLTYACYELAKSRTIQDKLRTEILEIFGSFGGFTFESFIEMKYMQQVLNELMRMYNGGPLLIRECNETCTLKTAGTIIEKGTLVMASLRGILMDEEYFPDPETFDPDRFLPENVEGFFPFGIGRHTCIGNKFALLQAKVFLAHLLSKYHLTLNNKTVHTFTDKNCRLAEDLIYLDVVPLNC